MVLLLSNGQRQRDGRAIYELIQATFLVSPGVMQRNTVDAGKDGYIILPPGMLIQALIS